MSRTQSFAPLVRSFVAPRPVVCRQHFRFSTATRLFADQSLPTAPSPASPPNASPAAPSTPQAAQRAADLAAAEAVTESDSAQPPAPKPTLPSTHSQKRSPKSSTAADSALPTGPPSPPRFKTFRPDKRGAKKTAATAPTQQSPLELSLPSPKYHVSRSAYGNFPIYTEYKRGGNLHLTTVRKITGDLAGLRDELRVFLNKKDEDVKINSLTGHVIVKGHCSVKVAEFLTARGM